MNVSNNYWFCNNSPIDNPMRHFPDHVCMHISFLCMLFLCTYLQLLHTYYVQCVRIILLVHVMVVVVAWCMSLAHVYSCKGRHFVLTQAALDKASSIAWCIGVGHLRMNINMLKVVEEACPAGLHHSGSSCGNL